MTDPTPASDPADTAELAGPASVLPAGALPGTPDVVGRPDRRPVLMIVHAYYDEDPRVRREAEALIAAGRPVIVIGLRRPQDPPKSVVAGVLVHRLDVQRHQGAGIGTYLREYVSFMMLAMRRAWRIHERRRVALVQVHSLPDFLVFAGVPLRLRGVPILLDLHEAMPEFFAVRFPGAASRPAQWAIRVQERVSILASNLTLVTTEAMRDRLVRLGERPSRLQVVPNSPAIGRFDPAEHPRRAFAEDGTVRLIYAGALTPIYELAVAIDAIADIRRRRPDVALALDAYGRGDSLPALQEQVARLGLGEVVRFHERVALDKVPALLAAADIGLSPTRLDDFTVLSLSAKLYEAAAMGKPVVSSALPMARRSFPNGGAWFYEPGDAPSLAAAIERVIDDPDARETGIRIGYETSHAGSWEHAAVEYVATIDRLAREG